MRMPQRLPALSWPGAAPRVLGFLACGSATPQFRPRVHFQRRRRRQCRLAGAYNSCWPDVVFAVRGAPRARLFASFQSTVPRRCRFRTRSTSAAVMHGSGLAALQLIRMMNEIAPRRKRRSDAARFVRRRSIRSMRRRTRHRIEQRKQHQAGEKSADMRLPGDAGAFGADRNRPEAEDDVDAEPDGQKSEHARVAQCPGKRQRWNLRRGIRIAPA